MNDYLAILKILKQLSLKSKYFISLKLKHLRKEIAKEKDMPSFRICSDITLREITRQKPINKDSLLAVRGIGEYFYQNYGDKFISIIAEHLNRE